MGTHSSILAWKILWTEEPGGVQSMGSHRAEHDWACRRWQERARPLQSRGLKQHWVPTWGTVITQEIRDYLRTSEWDASISPVLNHRGMRGLGNKWLTEATHSGLSHPPWEVEGCSETQGCVRSWLDVLSSLEIPGRPERTGVTRPGSPLESSGIWSNVSCWGLVRPLVFAYAITISIKLIHCFVKCFGISQV